MALWHFKNFKQHDMGGAICFSTNGRQGVFGNNLFGAVNDAEMTHFIFHAGAKEISEHVKKL